MFTNRAFNRFQTSRGRWSSALLTALTVITLAFACGTTARAQTILSGNFSAWASPTAEGDIAGAPVGDSVDLANTNSFPPRYTAIVNKNTSELFVFDSACPNGTRCKDAPGRTTYFFAAPTPAAASSIRLQLSGIAGLRPYTLFEVTLFSNHWQRIARIWFMKSPAWYFPGNLIFPVDENGVSMGFASTADQNFSLEVSMQVGTNHYVASVNGVVIGLALAEATLAAGDRLGVALSWANADASGSHARIGKLTMTAQ